MHRFWILALLGTAPWLLSPSAPPPAPALGSPDAQVSAGRSVLELDLRLDPTGRPVLAWVEEVSAESHPLFVQRLEGGVWRRLGGALNVDPGTAAQGVFVRPTRGGAIWAAFSENGGHADIVQFQRWNGSRWVHQRAMRQSIDLTYAARSRDLELDGGGTPLWAWAEITQTGFKVQTRRWNGTTWVRSEPLSLDPRTLALQPSLAVSGSNRALVWLEGDMARSKVWVKRWSGAGWKLLGGPLNVRPDTFTFAPVIGLDRKAQPTVAWLEDRGGVDTLFVKRWTGRRWTALGSGLNLDPAQFAERPSVAFDARDQPCVAWAEGGEARKRVVLKCWSGSRWETRSSTPATADARSPVLVSGAAGVLLAWREKVGAQYRLRLSQH